MKRLVFLDFDGVIMTRASYEAARSLRRPTNSVSLDIWERPIDPESSDYKRRLAASRMDPALVGHVSTLCETLDASIVLSTSWRGRDDADRMQLQLALWDRGLASSILVVGQTPGLPSRYRGAEIVAWLGEYRPGWTPEDVAVLDDDGDLEPLLERWVRSTFDDGFGEIQLREALALFGVEAPWR